jgi:hypothetical protein
VCLLRFETAKSRTFPDHRLTQPRPRTSFSVKDRLFEVPYVNEIDSIAQVYFSHKLMPLGSDADAHHLALAPFHRCDMLATWNCKHIANPNKTEHIRMVNGALGLHTLQLVNPFELLESMS